MGVSNVQRSATVSVRIDNRDLATLLAFFTKGKERPPRSKGGIVLTALKEFIHLLIINELQEPITSFDDAMDILTSGGIGIGVRPGLVADYLKKMNIAGLNEEHSTSSEDGNQDNTDISPEKAARIAALAEKIKGALQ